MDECTMDDGSYGGGFALGFLLGVIGLIIAIAINKEQTRMGAVTGFFVSLGLSVVAGVCYFCVVMASRGGGMY
jgi:hypothetical protein